MDVTGGVPEGMAVSGAVSVYEADSDRVVTRFRTGEQGDGVGDVIKVEDLPVQHSRIDDALVEKADGFGH